MEWVDVGQFHALTRLHVLFAQFVREALFSCIVVEGTNVHLITTRSVTLDALVLLWMVQPLDRGVALVAF